MRNIFSELLLASFTWDCEGNNFQKNWQMDVFASLYIDKQASTIHPILSSLWSKAIKSIYGVLMKIPWPTHCTKYRQMIKTRIFFNPFNDVNSEKIFKFTVLLLEKFITDKWFFFSRPVQRFLFAKHKAAILFFFPQICFYNLLFSMAIKHLFKYANKNHSNNQLFSSIKNIANSN